MDTTAAAELGLAEPDGAALWDAGSDQGDGELFDAVAHSGFGRGRALSGEPAQKASRSVADGNGGPREHSVSSGRGNAASPSFGSSTGPGAVAFGRGRGMGSIFYKTKLCCRFRSGNCPYNTNCNFAHGMEELRKPPPGWEEFVASQELPPPLPNGSGASDSQVRFHKTRPCKKYFGEGNCPYGEKCNFLHEEQNVPRVVREAREAALAGAACAGSPRGESAAPTANGNSRETGGGGASTPAGSATSNARPSSWKTRLCNKWETTGHCPFGNKCHFAHGSDELHRYGGGLSDPALSDSKSGGTPSRDSMAVSSHQRHQGGASSGSTSWRGPNGISTIYGDWWEEDDDWQCEGATTSYESTEHEAQRRKPLPKAAPFFRHTNSLVEPSRQSPSLINGCSSVSQQDERVHKQAFQYEGTKEGIHGTVLQPEHAWR